MHFNESNDLMMLLLNTRMIWVIFLDDMIVDMLSNKKPISIVTELSIRGRKLSISIVFITQSYFAVPKDIRINSMHYYLILKIPNKWEFKQITFHNSSDIDFNDFMNFYKKCFTKPYSLLVADTTLALDNPLYFRKNLIERI